MGVRVLDPARTLLPEPTQSWSALSNNKAAAILPAAGRPARKKLPAVFFLLAGPDHAIILPAQYWNYNLEF